MAKSTDLEANCSFGLRFPYHRSLAIGQPGSECGFSAPFRARCFRDLRLAGGRRFTSQSAEMCLVQHSFPAVRWECGGDVAGCLEEGPRAVDARRVPAACRVTVESPNEFDGMLCQPIAGLRMLGPERLVRDCMMRFAMDGIMAVCSIGRSGGWRDPSSACLGWCRA